METKLTKRQEEVLRCIVEFQSECDYAPSIMDICERMGIRSTNGVVGHIRALMRKGFLERSSKARSLRLTDLAKRLYVKEKEKPPTMIPLVGRISAGLPITAEENIERWITFEGLSTKSGLFALRVVGDSMIEAGIFDGDIIIVDPKKVPKAGDIVVALVGGEVTVKRFYIHDNKIELRPANRMMKSIFVPAKQVSIQGVVVGLQRLYE